MASMGASPGITQGALIGSAFWISGLAPTSPPSKGMERRVNSARRWGLTLFFGVIPAWSLPWSTVKRLAVLVLRPVYPSLLHSRSFVSF